MAYHVRLQPGQKVRLADHDPDADGGLDKQAGREALAALRKQLAELQQELYAAGCNSVLVVLQGMDTSGKDGTIVCKFFLHISQDERRRRLLAREQDVAKAYKLSPGDWRERERWDDYMAAYQDALRRCGTEEAPWHLIPANRKWYRNLAVAEALVEALRGHRKQWQRELERLSRERLAELAKIKAEAQTAAAQAAEANEAEAQATAASAAS